MNEIVVLIVVTLSLSIIYGLYKILNKQGIYFAIVILSILGYVLSFKITTILRMNVNLGATVLICAYTCLYLILLKYGDKDINRIYKMSLYANIIFGLLIAIMIYCVPTITDSIATDIKETFISNYKLLIIYPVIFLLGEYLINKIFKYVTAVQNNIFLTVMLSYIISAVIYIIIYYLLGYINVISFRDSLYLGITTYIIGIIVTIINIGFIYLLTRKKVKK